MCVKENNVLSILNEAIRMKKKKTLKVYSCQKIEEAEEEKKRNM